MKKETMGKGLLILVILAALVVVLPLAATAQNRAVWSEEQLAVQQARKIALMLAENAGTTAQGRVSEQTIPLDSYTPNIINGFEITSATVGPNSLDAPCFACAPSVAVQIPRPVKIVFPNTQVEYTFLHEFYWPGYAGHTCRKIMVAINLANQQILHADAYETTCYEGYGFTSFEDRTMPAHLGEALLYGLILLDDGSQTESYTRFRVDVSYPYP